MIFLWQIFWHLCWHWFLIHFGSILVPKMGPKMVPKSIKNRSKNGPKSIQNRFWNGLRLRSRFWTDFGGILAPTWSRLGGQDGSMLGPCWPKESIFGAAWRHSKMIIIFNAIRDPLGADFGTILGSKMEPKSIQDRCQERSCNKCKIFKNPSAGPMFLRIREIENRSKNDQKSC